MLAQVRQQSWFLETVETLARTPISSVILFALGCTIVRVGLNYYVKSLDPVERQSFSGKLAQWTHDLADALVYAGILVFLLVRPYALQTFKIPSPSMVPTLKVGDLLIVNKAIYRYSEPKSGDIVVFKPPPFARNPGDNPNIDFVKRLIGTPGQVIEIRDNQLYRDGVQVNEPYVNERSYNPNAPANFKLVEYPQGSGQIVPLIGTAAKEPAMSRSLYAELVPYEERQSVWDLPAVAVPAGKYLMIGDNRDGSFDGRFWGLIERRDIVGKAWLTFWPVTRFGLADKRP